MIHRTVIVVGLVVAASLLAGCDSWKAMDGDVALLTVPDVKPVTVDGRDLIRIQMKRSAAWIDMRGTVVNFKLMPRPDFSLSGDSSSGPDDLTPVEIGAGGSIGRHDGFAKGEEWKAVGGGDARELDQSSSWVVDGDTGEFTLLSDSSDGLRWSRTFRLNDAGTLEIQCTLKNVSFGERTVTAMSSFPADRVVASGVKGGADYIEYREMGGFRLVRRLIARPAAAAPPTLPPDTDAPHDELPSLAAPRARAMGVQSPKWLAFLPYSQRLVSPVVIGGGWSVAWTEEWSIVLAEKPTTRSAE